MEECRDMNKAKRKKLEKLMKAHLDGVYLFSAREDSDKLLKKIFKLYFKQRKNARNVHPHSDSQQPDDPQ
jgi:hypothetical protein